MACFLLSTKRGLKPTVNAAKIAAIAIVLSILAAVPAYATTGCIAMGPNYLCVDAYPGATFDQKVNACIAALPVAGGTCDGRALPQTDTMSASVTLTAGVTVL